MRYALPIRAALCIALAYSPCVLANAFSFGVISPSASHSDEELRTAIEAADADNLAFVVANGIKASDEPCSDQWYEGRKALFQESKNGLIVSLTGGDWADCRAQNGRLAAIGSLNRLRDLFFGDEWSEGGTKIPLIRQSASARFRSFAENTRWEIGDTMFATINLPAPNNHYVFDAGRNSEFEDRLVANRDWLNRIFTVASLHKLHNIVLFCDGDPLLAPPDVKRDGFAETRRQLLKLAAKFRGRILIVHRQDGMTPSIDWQGNIGKLNSGGAWIKVEVNTSASIPFTLVPRIPPSERKR